VTDAMLIAISTWGPYVALIFLLALLALVAIGVYFSRP
jgi:hypothetical protein